MSQDAGRVLTDDNSKLKPKAQCKYGDKCYRKSAQHLKDFSHPTEKRKLENSGDTKGTPNPKRKSLDLDGWVKRTNKDVGDSENQRPDLSGERLGTTSKGDIHPDFPPASNDGKGEDGKKSDVASVALDLHDDEDDDEEYIVPPSPIDVKESIKQKFLVQMPGDFYKFWEFCSSVNSKDPSCAFSDVGLVLVGPFDVLSKKIKNARNRSRANYLCHWRYYYDPPEFQTVLKGDDESGYHIGYYRDDPNEDPVFVGCNSSEKDGNIKPLGGNLFAAVRHYLDGNTTDAATKLKKLLEQWSKKHNFSLDRSSDDMKKRDKLIVSKTFHGAGIVVPYNRKTKVGYREIYETNANLKKIFKKIASADTREEGLACVSADLPELMTNAQWANDEGDVGMSLELGLDMFTFGTEYLHKHLLHLLEVAYNLLGRPQFAEIIKAHINNRRKGTDLSAF